MTSGAPLVLPAELLPADGRFGCGPSKVRPEALAALAETAGSEVLDAIVQRRDKPDPGTYLGRGKAAELKEIVEAVGAVLVGEFLV